MKITQGGKTVKICLNHHEVDKFAKATKQSLIVYFCSQCKNFHFKENDPKLFNEHSKYIYEFTETMDEFNDKNSCYLYYCTDCETFHEWVTDNALYKRHFEFALFFYYCTKCKHVHHYGKKFQKHLTYRAKEITSYKNPCKRAVREYREGDIDEINGRCT